MQILGKSITLLKPMWVKHCKTRVVQNCMVVVGVILSERQSAIISGAPRGVWGVDPPFWNRTLVFQVKCPTLCKCSTCCYCKTAVTEFAPHHTEDKSAGWCSGKRHCYQCRQRRIQGGMCRMHPPTSHLQTCFWRIQFFYNFEPFQ